MATLGFLTSKTQQHGMSVHHDEAAPSSGATSISTQIEEKADWTQQDMEQAHRNSLYKKSNEYNGSSGADGRPVEEQYHGASDFQHYAVEFGTIEDFQQDESEYDDRSRASLEQHRLVFPRDKLYGRDEELNILQSMHNHLKYHSNTGSAAARLVFLGGPSGSGKSSLVEEFVQRQEQPLKEGGNRGATAGKENKEGVPTSTNKAKAIKTTASGNVGDPQSPDKDNDNKDQEQDLPPLKPILWQGKFDQMNNNTTFSAVASALNEYFLQFQSKPKNDGEERNNEDKTNVNVQKSKDDSSPETLQKEHMVQMLQQRLKKQAQIYPGSENYQLLYETVLPALKHLWGETDSAQWISTKSSQISKEGADPAGDNHEDDATVGASNNKKVTSATPPATGDAKQRQRSISFAESVDSAQSGRQQRNININKESSARNSKTIQFAFVQLIKAVSTAISMMQPEESSSPIIFFIDDLQWADSASIQFLKMLMQEMLENTVTNTESAPASVTGNTTVSEKSDNNANTSVASNTSTDTSDLKRYTYQQNKKNALPAQPTSPTKPARKATGPIKILFIAAYRSDEIPPGHEFGEMRRELLEAIHRRQEQQFNSLAPMSTSSRGRSQEHRHSFSSSGEHDFNLSTLQEEGKEGMSSSAASSASSVPSSVPMNGSFSSTANLPTTQLTLVMELSNLSPDSVGEYIVDCLTLSAGDGEEESEDDYGEEEEDADDGWTTERVLPITQAVYSKTLGNMFGVQQAMEALVRKNAIYYDVISFSWQFNAKGMTQIEMEDCLSENVVQMVQDKLQLLPKPLQTALAMAAYTNQSVSLDLLFKLMLEHSNQYRKTELKKDQGESKIDSGQMKLNWDSPARTLTVMQLDKLMEIAFKEGLVLKDIETFGGDSTWQPQSRSSAVRGKKYKFAHDRIREAARASVPPGDELNNILLEICRVLLECAGFLRHRDSVDAHSMRSSKLLTSNDFASLQVRGPSSSMDEDTNWMLYTAVGHLNALPLDMTNDMHVAELNLAVGKISTNKGAFDEALGLFRHALSRLDEDARWSGDMYEFTLDLLNHMTDCERSLSNFDSAKKHAEEIFRHANRGVTDKFRAQSAYISVYYEEDRDSTDWIQVGLDICETYGITGVPARPKITNVVKEMLATKFALKGRSFHKLMSEYPKAEDEFVLAHIAIMNVVTSTAVFAKQDYLIGIMANRQVVAALKYKVVTKELVVAVSVLQHVMAKYGKWKESFGYTNIMTTLIDRFAECRNEIVAIQGRVVRLRGTLYAYTTFREASEQYFEFNRLWVAKGMSFFGLAAAISGCSAYFISSLPLNAVIESKILLLEEMCSAFGQETLLLTFQIHRQFLYNLTGARESAQSATALEGPAFRESDKRELCVEENLADIYILRLMLSVYYNDHDGMELMVERLDESAVNALFVGRQYLHLTYIGIACMILQKRRKRKLFNKWAKKTSAWFGKLAKAGSVNSQPIHACLEAMHDPSIPLFEKAIRICGESRLNNLVGLMSERCALWILEANRLGELPGRESCSFPGSHKPAPSPPEGDEYKQYLVQALWNYHAWGAMGKVNQLTTNFAFLRGAKFDKPPSTLSSGRDAPVGKGVPAFVK